MMSGRRLAPLFAIVALLPSVAAAQGTISAGETKNGVFVTGQTKLSDGSYYDDWTFSGSAGQRVIIAMKSSAFDTYLNLGRGTGNSFQSLTTNDDASGGGTDSEIDYVLPSSGEYTIRANSLGDDETGNYTLSLRVTGGSGTVAQSGSTSRTTSDYMQPMFRELMTFVDAQSGKMQFMVMNSAPEDASHTIMRINVTAGTLYTIRGACDADCTDLDIKVADAAGKELGSDSAVDDHPTVSFKATTTGEVRVTATMATCKAQYCYYGVVAMSRR